MKMWIGLYLIFINLLGLWFMYSDKRRAIHHKYRISEKSLFLVAVLGGSVGSIAGMYLFHHKTRHWYFAAGMPAILCLQILAVFLVLQSFGKTGIIG